MTDARPTIDPIDDTMIEDDHIVRGLE